MIKHHPFLVLLVLLVGLGVLVSSIAPHWASKAVAPLCEVENECLEEALEDLNGDPECGAENPAACMLSLLELSLWTSDLQRMAGACGISPSLCSFGWVLPLRI